MPRSNVAIIAGARISPGLESELLNALGEGVIATDTNGRIMYWNQGAARLYGWSADEVLGLNILDVTPSDQSRAAAAIIFERLTKGEMWSGEFETKRKDGTTLLVSVNDYPVRDRQGNLTAIVGVSSALSTNLPPRAGGEAAQRLAAIVESSDDAIISKDLNGVIKSWNAGAQRMFGYTAEEVIDLPVTILMPPDRVNEELGILARIRAGERIDHYETVRQRKDGTLLDISLTVSPVRNAQGTIIGASKIARDISERKKMEKQRDLLMSEERFRNMANRAPVMLWMAGRDKLCDFFNEGWLEFTGRTVEQELGNGWAEGVHPDDSQRCLETYHSAFDARQPFEMDYRLRRHDGQYRWVLDRGSPRFECGEFMGYVGCAVDITDRKRAEENDRQLAHLQRVAALGNAAAVITHELKQPLAAIMTNAETGQRWLESANPPLGELREIVSDILEDDKRASEIIGRIREFTTRRETQVRPFDLNSAVADALRIIGGEATRQHVQLRAELAEGLPPALGDRVQVQQVLINLALNGVEAMTNTPAATRCLTIQTAVKGGGDIEVAVMDRGTGIAPDKLAHLFEPFTTTKAEGMGLGLAISKSIIESHRGRIWAENIPGGGAAVHFTVPAEIQPPN